MSRNLSDLKAECAALGLTVSRSGKREAKEDYETVLRQFHWEKEYPGLPMLEQIQPMLARNIKDVPESLKEEMLQDGGRWFFQKKLDGCRCIMHVNPKINPFRKDDEVRNEMISRRESDETYRLNEMTDKLPFWRDFPLPSEWHGAVVDGEVIMPVAEVNTGDTVTKNVLQATAATLNCAPEKAADIQRRHGNMRYEVFDLLRGKGGVDLTDQPYAVLNSEGRVVGGRYYELQQLVKAVEQVCQEKGWQVP